MKKQFNGAIGVMVEHRDGALWILIAKCDEEGELGGREFPFHLPTIQS